MIKPLRGYVLILPDDEQEKTASGLILPDSAKEKPQKGEAIAIGETGVSASLPGMGVPITSMTEYWGLHPGVKEGDKVIYNRWAGKEVKDDGKEYVLVKFEDCLAVVE